MKNAVRPGQKLVDHAGSSGDGSPVSCSEKTSVFHRRPNRRRSDHEDELTGLRQTHARAIASALSAVTPIVVVDSEAALLWGNSLGMTVLKSRRLLAQSEQRLVMPTARAQERFERLLRPDSTVDRLLVRDDATDDWVVIRFLSCQIDDRAAFVLRFAFAEPMIDCHASGLAQHFALTRTEIAVLNRFANIASPEQIARDMRIALATVRSHLKRIYSKTGVKSGRGLMRIVEAFESA